jgi:hypothetical protein
MLSETRIYPPTWVDQELGARRLKLNFTDNKDLILRWCYRTLEDYCGRRVTIPSDRLPAISSIARLFNQQLQSEYVAGVFATEIFIGLAWASLNYHLPLVKDERNIHPSFSWVAQADKRIRWHRFSFRNVYQTCQLESAQVSRYSQDAYGAVESAKLMIRGRFIQVSLKDTQTQTN